MQGSNGWTLLTTFWRIKKIYIYILRLFPLKFEREPRINWRLNISRKFSENFNPKKILRLFSSKCVCVPGINGLAEVPFKLSCKDYSPHGMAMALKNCSLTSGAGSPGLQEVLVSPSLRTFPLDNKLEGQPGSLTHSTLWRKLWHLFESFSRGLPPFAYFVVQTHFQFFFFN